MEPASEDPRSLSARGDGGVPVLQHPDELREFLAMVSVMKPEVDEPASGGPGPDPEPGRSRPALVAACILVALGCAAYLLWPAPPTGDLPQAIRGAWITTDTGYADRGFWIGAREVAFQVAPDRHKVAVYPLERFGASSAGGDTTRYDLEYRVDGGTARWSFRFIAGSPDAIVFLHQPRMTWFRTPDSSPPVH